MRYLILPLLLIFISCSPKNPQQVFHEIPKRIQIDLDDIKPLENFIENIQIINPEEDKHLIGNIDKLIIDDHKLVILDRKYNRVFIFDKFGKKVRTIDSHGHGPQEYQRIRDISYRYNHLIIYDDLSHRIIMYDDDGDYLKTIKVDFTAEGLTWLSPEIVVFNNQYNANYNDNTGEYNLILVNTDGKIINKLLSLIDSQSIRTLLNLTTEPFSMSGDIQHFCLPYNDTIYTFNEISIEQSSYVDFGPRKLTWSMVTPFKTQSPLAFANFINSGDFASTIHYFTFINDFIFFAFAYKGPCYALIDTRKGISTMAKVSGRLPLFGIPLGYYNQSIIFKLHAVDFNNFYNKLSGTDKVNFINKYPQFQFLINNNQMLDNPYILLCNLKSV